MACQADQGDVTGNVRLNGASRTPRMIKECAAYVRQDDRLLPHLSVKETLSFVAKLKLPKDWSYQEVQQRVGHGTRRRLLVYNHAFYCCAC